VKSARFLAPARAVAFPESGFSLVAGTRRVYTKGFALSVVRRLKPETIVVVAVAHQARCPGYWQGCCRDSHDKPASAANGMICGIPESLHGWLKRQTERRRCSVNKADMEFFQRSCAWLSYWMAPALSD
jgi:hypothetical protein